MHKWLDSGEYEIRKGIRFERGVHIAAENLGISGIINMVDHNQHTGYLKPIKYKCDSPKPFVFDEIQVCTQALCLEEMSEQTIAGSRCGICKLIIACRYYFQMDFKRKC